MENAIVRVPSLAEMEVVRLVNGPEAFTPDGEFISALRTCAASGPPRASVRMASPAPVAWAGSWWSGSSTAPLRSTSGTWIRVGSGRHTRVASTRSPHEGDLRDVLRRQVPGPRAAGWAPAAHLSRLQPAPETRCGVRGEVGLGAGELVRAECGAGKRVVAASWLGRDALSPAIGADFIGREALAAAGEPERRLRCLTLDDPHAIALGSEPVRVGEELVGRVTSGGYGLHGRAVDRLRLPARRAWHRHGGRPRDVRRVRAGRDRRGASLEGGRIRS
jgi:hypothetical protein